MSDKKPIKGYKKNPRKISKQEQEKLRKSLIELGDLSGIVHNQRTGEIISGNQRSTILDINECEIVITETLPEKDSQGTISWGYVLWKDGKYNYRLVDWDDAQEEKANIAANKLGGDWDMEILKDFNFDMLSDMGFKDFEIQHSRSLLPLDKVTEDKVVEATSEPNTNVPQPKENGNVQEHDPSTAQITNHQKVEDKKPTASQDDYSMFQLVMIHTNKNRLSNCLNQIRKELGIDKIEDALMHLVKSYENE